MLPIDSNMTFVPLKVIFIVLLCKPWIPNILRCWNIEMSINVSFIRLLVVVVQTSVCPVTLIALFERIAYEHKSFKSTKKWYNKLWRLRFQLSKTNISFHQSSYLEIVQFHKQTNHRLGAFLGQNQFQDHHSVDIPLSKETGVVTMTWLLFRKCKH